MSENTESTNPDAQISHLEGQLEAAGINPNPEKPAPEEKPSIFGPRGEEALTAELGKIYDKAEAREERKPDMPAIEGEGLRDRFERAHEWMQLPKAEKRLQSDGAQAIADLKATAEKYNLTIEQAELIKQGELMKSANEHAPVVEHLRGAFSGSTPVESAKFFRETTESFRRDPVGTVAHLGTQAGLHPLQLAQEIYQRFGNRPQAHQSNDAQLAAVEAMVGDFAAKNARFEDLQDSMFEILQSDAFQKSRQPADQKLRAAYSVALKRDRASSFEDRMIRTMRSVANKQGLR